MIKLNITITSCLSPTYTYVLDIGYSPRLSAPRAASYQFIFILYELKTDELQYPVRFRDS